MKRQNRKLKRKLVPFQTDIVIDEDGNIAVSLLGKDICHLADVSLNVIYERSSLSIDMEKNLEDVSFDMDYISCRLCPHLCGFDRTKNVHPRCGDHKFRVASYGVSYGDEPCISQGGGSGVILMSGCPLTCPSCINYEKVQDCGIEIKIGDFIEMAEDLYNKGANNLQILSPTVHLPYLRESLKILKENKFPIPIIFKSSGYELDEQISKFDGLIDIYLPDYKSNFCLKLEKRSNSKNYHAYFSSALTEMYRQVGDVVYDGAILSRGVLVRHVKNPSFSREEQLSLLDYLESLPKGIVVSVLDNFLVMD